MSLLKLILPLDQQRLVSGNVSTAELYWHSANGKLLFGAILLFYIEMFFQICDEILQNFTFTSLLGSS